MVLDCCITIASTIISIMMNGVCCMYQHRAEQKLRDAIRHDVRSEFHNNSNSNHHNNAASTTAVYYQHHCNSSDHDYHDHDDHRRRRHDMQRDDYVNDTMVAQSMMNRMMTVTMREEQIPSRSNMVVVPSMDNEEEESAFIVSSSVHIQEKRRIHLMKDKQQQYCMNRLPTTVDIETKTNGCCCSTNQYPSPLKQFRHEELSSPFLQCNGNNQCKDHTAIRKQECNEEDDDDEYVDEEIHSILTMSSASWTSIQIV